MIKIHKLALGLYQTNTYIIHDADSKTCCVIDPGYEAPAILREVDHLGLSVEAILLTHGHFDHVGGVKKIAEKTGCQVFLHPDELSLPPFITSGKLYYTDTYAEGDEITLAGMTFTVLHTPGHTPGAVCLHFGDHLFTGDTLFAGSCGRTDLRGGNYEQMLQSLKRLALLEGDFHVLPGHDVASTLDRERQTNYYMKEAMSQK